MGDLLIHEGPALRREKHAAAGLQQRQDLLRAQRHLGLEQGGPQRPADPRRLVLFDRNNHKSIHQGALFQAGATPVYLETARNPYGFIGGIDAHCFDEDYLRELLGKSPRTRRTATPVPPGVIQLGTYDGTIYNARQVVDRIGKLCDYILFDSAWVGYEQFIPMMKDCSPLLLDLSEDDPGIFVTQSVHKQQAGFSQASQVHKKDAHIKGQTRYCQPSPLQQRVHDPGVHEPLLPALRLARRQCADHSGGSGLRLWARAVEIGIEARKLILRDCSMVRPFVPSASRARSGRTRRPRRSRPTASSSRSRRATAGTASRATREAVLHDRASCCSPPRASTRRRAVPDFGIHAGILANFLRENGIVPEKCDLNSILFLLTPAEDWAKMTHLAAQITRFEASSATRR